MREERFASLSSSSRVHVPEDNPKSRGMDLRESVRHTLVSDRNKFQNRERMITGLILVIEQVRNAGAYEASIGASMHGFRV